MQCSVLVLRCFDTAVVLLGSSELAESTSEVVRIVSPPPLSQAPPQPVLFTSPAPPSMQWENVYLHLNGINAAVKLFQLETAVRMMEASAASRTCIVLGTADSCWLHLHCSQTTADKQMGWLCPTVVLMAALTVSKPPTQPLG